MSMIPPFRFCRLRGRNGPKIVATQPFFDLPPPFAAAAGDTGDSAVPSALALRALALPAQASSDQEREPWEIRDGPKLRSRKVREGVGKPRGAAGVGGTTPGPAALYLPRGPRRSGRR